MCIRKWLVLHLIRKLRKNSLLLSRQTSRLGSNRHITLPKNFCSPEALCTTWCSMICTKPTETGITQKSLWRMGSTPSSTTSVLSLVSHTISEQTEARNETLCILEDIHTQAQFYSSIVTGSMIRLDTSPDRAYTGK